MQLALLTSLQQLQGTWYYEFFPGLFKGTHWNQSSVFLDGDAFVLVEGIFWGCVPNFAPYGPTTVSGRVLEQLAKELKALEKVVLAADGAAEVHAWGGIEAALLQGLPDWPAAKPQILRMLQDLRRWLLAVRAADRPVSILGL